MSAQENVVSLAARRRARDSAVAFASRRVPKSPVPSIEIERAQLATFASPRVQHQLALLLDDEFECAFTPRATMIERLRFTHTSDEFVDIVRITLAQTR